MKLIDAELVDMANYSFHGLLGLSIYLSEQFETIFIKIGAFWEFDLCNKESENIVDLWGILPYIL